MNLLRIFLIQILKICIFLNEDNIIEKIKYLYEKIPKNEMEIVYKNNKSKIRIFGENFVNNNKDNCYIMIDNKKYKIQEYLPIETKNNIIKIKLIENE